MSVKMTGREFREFYADDWGGPERYVEEIGLSIDGVDQDDDYDVDNIADDAKVVIAFGMIGDNIDQEYSADLVRVARKWLKDRSTVTIVTDIPRERETEFRELVAQFLG